MKKILLLIISVLFYINLIAQTITISEASGNLESAFVKWTPVAEAQSYNVYYTGGGVTDKKIDNQLIRDYGTYFRADVLGLSAGEYTLRVVPVISGTEGAGSSTSALTVLPQDRTGFAFHGGRVPGAYKADGTTKDNAVIIYITENNKNTISMTVTGANSNPCVGLQEILDGFKKGNDTRPLIVRLVGQITDLDYMLGGDIVIENKENASSYITFEGVGNDAVADGWGLRIKNATNIEVRNIGFMNCDSNEGDNIGLQQENTYIWVHNCDLFYGNAGSDADQIKGDGAMDSKRSTYVTFSYNHFWDTGKSNLLGLSEGTTSGLYVTYHHNWYDHSDSRHPRVRYYSAHVYNNYYDGVSKYGIGSTLGSSVFVEGNYFRNCKNPMLISMQGTDVWDSGKQANDYSNMPTFSEEDGGIIKAYNNTFDYSGAQPRFVAYGDPNPNYNISGKISSTVDFDAYVVTNRGEQVPSTVKSVYGSNTYNNFDTDASLYVKNITIETSAVAKETVMQFAGRVEGGDFKWTFDNAVDDNSYAVISGLKSALGNYETTLLAVQGENTSSSSTQTLTSSGNNDQTVQSGNAIENIVFTWSGDATDASVTGLPASGIDFVKNTVAKTITISGTPSATVSYTVTTSGASGTPVSLSGTITVSVSGGGSEEEMVHNFTTDDKNSTFYSISGNLSTSKGTVNYEELTLTQCLKIESSTAISFTTTQNSTLTLVFAETGKKILIDNNEYTSDASGIVTVELSAGSHEIKKKDVMNLFYMKTVYDTSTNTENVEKTNVQVYPNPVSDVLYIDTEIVLTRVEIYALSGQLLKQILGNVTSINLSDLPVGNHLIRMISQEGAISKMIQIKK
ncbi:MAG: T9SS type A sorting domain-containing protein [Paludibacteraceae bacterium]